MNSTDIPIDIALDIKEMQVLIKKIEHFFTVKYMLQIEALLVVGYIC